MAGEARELKTWNCHCHLDCCHMSLVFEGLSFESENRSTCSFSLKSNGLIITWRLHCMICCFLEWGNANYQLKYWYDTHVIIYLERCSSNSTAEASGHWFCEHWKFMTFRLAVPEPWIRDNKKIAHVHMLHDISLMILQVLLLLVNNESFIFHLNVHQHAPNWEAMSAIFLHKCPEVVLDCIPYQDIKL